MDEKLICCQVCQVAYILSVPVLIFNQICLGWASTPPLQTKPARQIPLYRLCQMFSVLLSLLCEDLIKVVKFKDTTLSSTDHRIKVFISEFSLLWSRVVKRDRNHCGSGQRKLLYRQYRMDDFPPLAARKFETWSFSANALLHPPPHECEHQVHFVSMSAISAFAMLCCAYVLQ